MCFFIHVPKIGKNLVSGHVINRCGYKQLFEYAKYVLTKCGTFFRFGYYYNGMFRLNVNTNKVEDSIFMACSSIDHSSLFHARLGHLHYKRMLEMSKNGLIPYFDVNTKKCKTCMLTCNIRIFRYIIYSLIFFWRFWEGLGELMLRLAE